MGGRDCGMGERERGSTVPSCVCEKKNQKDGKKKFGLACSCYLARFSALTQYGSTPLHLAAQCGHTATVDALIQARADVNAVNVECNGTVMASGDGAMDAPHNVKSPSARMMMQTGAAPARRSIQ